MITVSTWIFTHGDSDGICAGALALAANTGARVFFTHPVGLGGDLKHVEAGGEVIICDIALNEDDLNNTLGIMKILASKGRLVYIDHHPLPPTLAPSEIPGRVLHSTRLCASELTFRAFRRVLPEEMSRVAMFGAIGDYADNTPLIKELLRSWDKRALYMEAGILIQGILGSKRDYDFKRAILNQLSRNSLPSQNRRLVTLALAEAAEDEDLRLRVKENVETVGGVAYVLDIEGSIAKAAIYARASAKAKVGIAGETRGEFIDMSLRAPGEKIDLNKILRSITQKYRGTGGGHALAAGARVPKIHFKEFIADIAAYIEGDPTCG